MKLLDHFLRRYADSTDKQLGFLLDDDVNQRRQIAFVVIVLVITHELKYVSILAMKRYTHVGLARISSNLGDEQVDAKWSIFILQILFNGLNLEMRRRVREQVHGFQRQWFATHLLPKHFRRVPVPSDDPQAASIGDCGRQFRTSSNIHTYRQQTRRSGPASVPFLGLSAAFRNSPASRMGCLIPKSCVMGVEITDMVCRSRENLEIGYGGIWYRREVHPLITLSLPAFGRVVPRMRA